MSEKRRDNKGRVLRMGETQRPDGRYEFKFTDLGGKRRTIYSWRLVETDKAPPGKHNTTSLREAEERVMQDVRDGIDHYAAMRITLNEYWQTYLASRHDLRATTRNQYVCIYNKHIEPELGKKQLSAIKFDHIRSLYTHILAQGFKFAVVRSLQAMLHPVFLSAIRSGYIRVNPTADVMAEIKRTHDCRVGKRAALTEQEQAEFVDFVANSPKFSRYLSLFTVLLGTGMRIGECTGLRWQDIDFDANTISVNHTLVYCTQPGETKKTLHLNPPKTQTGNREIPMLTAVRRALVNERLYQMEHGMTLDKVDGSTGFIFQTTKRRVLMPTYVYNIIREIADTYNSEAPRNGKPLLPHFSAHNLRHTFCTRFCENETNIKVIQEIMGHSSIKTTMDIYSEATREKKTEAFSNLEGKMKIG